MSIEFIFEEQKKRDPFFSDVEIHQFFVFDKCLFQKTDYYRAAQITNCQGYPYSTFKDFALCQIIDRIIPQVQKIKY